MTEKNRNLLIRITTAVWALPLVLFLLYKGGFFTAALLGFAAAACTYEYLDITLKTRNQATWFAVGLAVLMPFLPVVRPVEATALACGLIGLVLLFGWTYHLLNGPLPEAPVRTAHILMGFVYGTGGLVSLMAIRQLAPDGIWWVVAALVVTWGNDTSAYFAGRFLGKHKLYPEVSPNKTWEGFFGGMAGSIAMLLIQRQFFFPAMNIGDAVVMGVLGGVLGPAGDLCESMLKRAYGVKDSGKIIPGHGGMLDRVDALIFNAPMVLLYVQFVRPAMGS